MMGLCFYFVFWYFFYFFKLGLSNRLPDMSHRQQYTFKVISWTINFLFKSVTCCSVLSRLSLKVSFKNCILSCSPYKFCQAFLYNLFFTHHFLFIASSAPLPCVFIFHILQLLHCQAPPGLGHTKASRLLGRPVGKASKE